MTGDEVCCSWGCGSGACETCPCCCAGWCIGGRDGIPGTPDCEPDAAPDEVAYFWAMAAQHNPIARRVVDLECPHLSWTGVEADTDLDDPAKVWRCDGCGQTRTGAEQAAVDGPPIRVVEP